MLVMWSGPPFIEDNIVRFKEMVQGPVHKAICLLLTGIAKECAYE